MALRRFVLVAVFSFIITNIGQAMEEPSVLSIGTTGDYPPLTYFNLKTHEYGGEDIELIKAFADSEKLEIRFVPTSWQNLSKDLEGNQFDLAIGGISLTPEREAGFLVSVPIGYSGKVALVRCQDVAKYQTLDEINQSSVRVVENMGGTNAEFAKKHLTKAQVIFVPEAELTFQYLQGHKADVMITDSTEAIYRQSMMPGLCAVNPTHFLDGGSAKVVLFSKQNVKLQQAFNIWFQSTQKK